MLLAPNKLPFVVKYIYIQFDDISIFFQLILFFSKWKVRRENNFTNSKMADQEKPTDQTSDHHSTFKCDIVVALDVGTRGMLTVIKER